MKFLRIALAVSLFTCFLRPTLGTTVAILPGNDVGRLVADLAAVQLSQHDDIEVVDRSLVEQVQAEHKLTVFGDGYETLLLGQLSGVDVFAVWTVEANANRGRLVLLDGRNSIRIADHSVTANDEIQLADEVVKSIAADYQMMKESTLQARHLSSLISVRNIDIPPERQQSISDYVSQFERAVVNFVTFMSSGSPSIIDSICVI